MEINSTKSDLMAKFLARQDMPKPKTSPLVESMKEDAFVSSKDNSQPLEAQAVKSGDTFVKSENSEVAAEEVKPEAAEKSEEEPKTVETKEPKAEETEEPKAEEQEVKEVKEVSETEEVKDEVSNEEKTDEDKASAEENVTKKPTVLDKIKGFFKNLFMKLKPKKKQVDLPAKNSSAGSTN